MLMPEKKEQSVRCAEVKIAGMTCQSCELLLERKLRSVSGVVKADINHRSGIATITAETGNLPDAETIGAVIRNAGYRLADDVVTGHAHPDRNKWIEIGGALLIIFALYKILLTFDLISLAPSTSGALSLGGIFVIGLVAGTSSCLAVTGGLLLALAAKHNEVHQAETPQQKFKPLLHFNIGRLVSYFILGGLVGVLGQSITLSAKMSGYMSIIVAFIMLYLALTILQVIPKGSLGLRPPKKLSHWIHDLSESDHPAAPFALGAFTFFLPCGFTQSLQIVALASGNFLTGALTMSVFALGTLPSLLGLSTIASVATGNVSRLFLRFSGALVLLLALFNLNSGFALAGIDLSPVFAKGSRQTSAPVPIIRGNVQEVAMTVTRSGYVPNNLTIKAGIPVHWKIDGTAAAGCTSIMTIPALGVSQAVRSGENIIEFTAPDKGPLAFMCSMGMVRGSFNVI